MRLSKVIAALLTLAIVAVPEVVAAQGLEQLFKQGYEAWEAGNHAQAETIWRQYIQRDPNNAEALINLGNALQDQGKLNEAIDIFRQAIQAKPDYAAAFYNLGIALSRQEKFGEAVTAYGRAIQLEPNFTNAYAGLGVTLYGQQRWNEAITALDKAIQLNPSFNSDPKFATTYYALGVELYNRNRLNESTAAFRKAIQLQPNYAGLYVNLGFVLEKQNKLDEALTFYYKAIQINPKLPEAYYYLGVALYRQGRFNEAIDAFSQATQLKPNYADAYNSLGVVLTKQAKTLPRQKFEERQQVDKVLDKAISALRQAIQLKPDADVYRNLGLALDQRREFNAAIKSYEKAIQLNPRFAEAYLSLAATLFELDKFDGAVIALRQAIQLKPDYAYAYYNLGIVLTKQATTTQNPDTVTERQELIKRSTVWHDFPLLDEAIFALRKAIQLKPNDPEFYRNLGSAFENRGKFNDAINAYQKAIEIDPNSIKAYADLKFILIMQGKKDEAAKINEEIIRRWPDNANAYLNLCYRLRDQNKLDQAIDACRKNLNLLDSKKDTFQFTRGFAYHELGQLLMKQEKLKEAIEHFEKAIQAGVINPPGKSLAEENLKEARRRLALQKNPQQVIATSQPYIVSSNSLTPLRRSVVQVLAEFPDGRTTSGTGFVVKRQDKEAWILTNRHVVFDEESGKDANSLKIQLYFNNLPRDASPPPSYRAELVRKTVSTDFVDLALMKVTSLPTDIQPLSIADEEVKDNTEILVLGSSDSASSTGKGKVIEVTQSRLWLKIGVSQGESGSPVLAVNRVVGMVYRATAGGDKEPSDVTYAVPSRLIVEKLDEWNFRILESASPRIFVPN